jgi:manganese transport protein
VLSQVILCFQLPFAIVPLVQATSNSRAMGDFASRGWLKGLAWTCAGVVTALDAVYVYLQMQEWAGGGGMWVYATMIPIACLLALFLGWVTLYPLRNGRGSPTVRPASTPMLFEVRYQRIGVAVELEGRDDAVVAQSAALARLHGAELVAIHVVEGPTAAFLGPAADDRESRDDRLRMMELVKHLRGDGLSAQGELGFGHPADELVRIVKEQQIELLVLGAHGHRLLADLALGSTVSPLLHRLTIPVLVVPGPR